MITCQLTKLETALEQIRKAYPKLKPTDAAMVASALSLTGRHATALYDGNTYSWPSDYEKLTAAMATEINQIQDATEPVKRTKSSPEEEPVQMTVGLAPNREVGEQLLKARKDLQQLLNDMIDEGVEFVYAPLDIGWQWALDRANWSTVSGRDMTRRVKVKAVFTQGATGVETGSGTTKKRASKAKAAAPVVEEEPAAAIEEE